MGGRRAVTQPKPQDGWVGGLGDDVEDGAESGEPKDILPRVSSHGAREGRIGKMVEQNRRGGGSGEQGCSELSPSAQVRLAQPASRPAAVDSTARHRLYSVHTGRHI